MSSPKRVLIIGEDPERVDFGDPAIPEGMDAAKVHAGLNQALAALRANGHEADLLLTTTDEAAGEEVAAMLRAQEYDCIVVGAGLRIVPQMTPVFEVVMNAVHLGAPNARLAFNLSPDDSAAAAERQLEGIA